MMKNVKRTVVELTPWLLLTLFLLCYGALHDSGGAYFAEKGAVLGQQPTLETQARIDILVSIRNNWYAYLLYLGALLSLLYGIISAFRVAMTLNGADAKEVGSDTGGKG